MQWKLIHKGLRAWLRVWWCGAGPALLPSHSQTRGQAAPPPGLRIILVCGRLFFFFRRSHGSALQMGTAMETPKTVPGRHALISPCRAVTGVHAYRGHMLCHLACIPGHRGTRGPFGTPFVSSPPWFSWRRNRHENRGREETRNMLDGTAAVLPSILEHPDHCNNPRQRLFPGGGCGAMAVRLPCGNRAVRRPLLLWVGPADS